MLRRILAIALFACLAQAQEFRSTLSGRVTDPSGAVVPAAKVAAIKADTNSRFETVANSDGLYTIPFLPPGPYTVMADATGFKKYVQEGIQIGTDTRVAQDITLTIGSAAESMTVTADASALETVSASAGQVITTREVENLPINGRAPMDLAVMGYGVVMTGVRDQNRPYENGGFSDFAVGGATSGANAVTLDGVPNVGTLGTSGVRAAFSPPVDAVIEVKVEAFNVDAAYGGAGGGTVEITTRGGTNQVHGAASEFNQASALAATPFFTNANGGQKVVTRQNQWGATLGGPVYIPKIYNGRDKVFFFFGYEGYKDSAPAPTFSTVPTAAERTGDFSGLLALNTKGKDYTLYDPSTGKLSGSSVNRTPFPGNIIPQNRINPVATKFLTSFIPLPNHPGNYDDTNNYFSNPSTPDNYHSVLARADFNLSTANKLTTNMRTSKWCQTTGTNFDNIAFGQFGCRDIWGGMIDDVHTFSPTLLGNFRVGFNRYRAYYDLPNFGYDPTQLGFPSYVTANATKLFIPGFNFNDGYTGNVGSTKYIDQPYNTYQVLGSVTKIAGAHVLKAGAEVRLQDFTNLNWAAATGAYTFDTGTWVKASTSASAPTLGGSMAQFLLGIPTSGTYNINAAQKSDSWYPVVFVQDDWHARPNLTINMGLRWEYSAPTTESHDRQSTGFDARAVNQVTQAAAAAYARSPIPQLPASTFAATGGLLFATPDNRAAYTTSHKSFSPRLGVSWSPGALKGRTVIRAGVGMFYYNYGVINGQQPGFSATNAYVATNDSFLTPAATLSNPFPNGIQQPVGAAGGLNTNLGQSINFTNPNLQNQYSLRWTFDLQHQLTKDTVVQVGYIGNHSVHLTTSYNFGTLPAQYLSTSMVRDQATINALGAVVANPFANLLPGSTLNGSTISVSNLLRPFPEFTGVTEGNMNNGGSYYHSANVRIQRRFRGGLQFGLNYNHSRLMERISYLNGGDLTLEKRVSANDRPNSLGFSGSYELPFGRGRHFLTTAPRAVNFVLGGWSAAGVYTYHTGAPLAWGNVIYLGGDLRMDARDVNHAFDTTRFNTVSAQQLSNNFRYFPSQFSNSRTDGTNNLNVTMTKNFQVTEKVRMQFRAESFNVCNRVLFGAPNLTPTATTFGVITTQTNVPRAIQAALRLTF
jgi:hypothetical protein